MPSHTARLNKAERAAQARKDKQKDAWDAKIKAMSDAELDELIGDIARDIVGRWEAAHGPVEPQDFSLTLVGLDAAARDKFFASLPDRDFVAWRKHDERIAAAKGVPVGSPHAKKEPPPL